MIVQGNPPYPGWVAAKIGEGNTRDGKKELNQYYPDDGFTETNPLKCYQSVFNKGMQGRFE